MLNFANLSNSAHAIGSAISNSARNPLSSIMNTFNVTPAKHEKREEKKSEAAKTDDGSPGKRKRRSMMVYVLVTTPRALHITRGFLPFLRYLAY